ncbi:hypothetical protein F5B18DRAFT_421159 [Nemania serpens]|nr:hypothetical protein F5B18DRAFT_421159 [Nemania serpens]
MNPPQLHWGAPQQGAANPDPSGALASNVSQDILQTLRLHDYGQTLLLYSPLYIPEYLQHLDTQTTLLERKLLYLLLKAEDGFRSWPRAWHHIKSGGAKVNKFDLEIIRVIVNGTYHRGFRATAIRRFPFLASGWRFSRALADEYEQYNISHTPPQRNFPRADKYRVPARATYKTGIIRRYRQTRARYIGS